MAGGLVVAPAPLEERPPALFVMITIYIICRYLHLIIRTHWDTLTAAGEQMMLTLSTLMWSLWHNAL